MKNLINKEIKLALHPTSFIFIFFAAMLLIPGYPYLVIYFYMCLSTFFICLTGRENKDAEFTLLLPIRKKDYVKARIITVMMIQIIQIALSVPFIILKSTLIPIKNVVGLDANIALLGFACIFFGIFNYIFFTKYYKDITKVGKPFLFGSIGVTIFLIAVEVSVHTIPFMRDYIDTLDPLFIGYKLIIFAVGIVFYLLITFLAYKKSARSFERLDL